MSSMQQEVDERTNLTGNNKFELFLFRLGTSDNSTQRELFGINVFKVREIMEMPQVTAVAGSHPHMLGVVNIRGQIVPVIDLPMAVGCTAGNGLRILMVTEFARSTQAFAVEEVDEIVRLEWNQVLSAEQTVGGGLITSIARLDGDTDKTRLAQVLDVEQILRNVLPSGDPDVDKTSIGPNVLLPAGSVILAADDSSLARSLIEQGLEAMGTPFIMTKTGKEAWEKLQAMAEQANSEGKSIKDKVALVLTDLEMPEMDGFTLTRNIKTDTRFAGIPVVIHSSLTGSTNEDHVKGVGADAYVAKFVAAELAATIRKVLGK
ncbi:chemotaxis protein [Janthinobacterium fluminis]|uniref:Chemotaxis protein n=1 Tax=Janthinobacterium fluminis TaxID=2987524 RepID=A0ABT5K464_9BURK|nr:chemotaxis protein [Janthinobacterium fluminis]MDC8759265.1 chemotaxis protein [Janthinobacterium fluminis]